MKKNIIHPLWTHLPALLSFITMIIFLLALLPLPSNAPVHFGPNSIPDRYGSPWEVLGMTIGLSVFFFGLSVFFDELWARQEKKKSFNWLSLMDEIIIGGMTGFTILYLLFLDSGATAFTMSWTGVALVGGITLGLGIVVEIFRPYREHTGQIPAGENTVLKTEISRRITEKSPFVYWDSQNPLYITFITLVLPLVMIGAAVLSWSEIIWVSIVLIVVGLLMVIPYGGQRVMITRDGLTVRWGIIGIRVLNLKIENISGVELREFSPLKDFGGYGIRFNREMKAYFLRGNLGVTVETTDGKKYLIGSDEPEKLFTVIQTIHENR